MGDQITRADAAVAELARLTTERDLTAAESAELYRERHELALVRHALEDDRDAARREAALATMERDTLRGLSDALRESDVRLRAEVAGLRAVVEGRTVPPTPQEIDHHWRMGGAWLVARSVVTDRAEALRLASVGIAGIAWVALGGMLRGGTPCPWPTVAAEAAGAALAGEGR